MIENLQKTWIQSLGWEDPLKKIMATHSSILASRIPWTDDGAAKSRTWLSEKVGLKLNIKKTKIMASGPTISWQIDGETMETVTDFIFLGSKITAEGDCSRKIKRHLLLGRKAMTNLDSILKGKDITFTTNACLVKAMFLFLFFSSNHA